MIYGGRVSDQYARRYGIFDFYLTETRSSLKYWGLKACLGLFY